MEKDYFQSHFGPISTNRVSSKSLSYNHFLSIPFWSDFNEGSLKDFYGAPVIGRTIKIEVASPNFTRVYNITTDSSGNFKFEVDMAKGIEYKVTYTFEGDDTYVETSTSKTFLVEQLLPAPPAPTEPLLIVAIVVAIGAGVVAVVYMAKKRTAVARTRIEEEFRFFRRLK
ncbi:MAG: hypothetical protein PWQ58_1093 [Archaeoglobaceae archaeon]|nr:hypothetical protein [Archaeoglobaceae archaeon]